MEQDKTDHQLLLEMRRDFDAFRDEMRAALKKIDEDTDIISDYAFAINKRGQDLGRYIDNTARRVIDHINLVQDMVTPLEQDFFPDVIKMRAKLETIRNELGKLKKAKPAEDPEKEDHLPRNDQVSDVSTARLDYVGTISDIEMTMRLGGVNTIGRLIYLARCMASFEERLEDVEAQIFLDNDEARTRFLRLRKDRRRGIVTDEAGA